MNIAIYGGAFDPIHRGHIDVAKNIVESYNIDKLLFVPSYNSPNKYGMTTDYNDRCAMCNLAIRYIPRKIRDKFEVSRAEEEMLTGVNRMDKSYTYLLLLYLHNAVYPNDKLFLIVGGDSFSYIMDWKYPNTIFKLATIIVIPRGEYDYRRLLSESNLLRDYGCNSLISSQAVGDVSSTDVREDVRQAYNNKSIYRKVYKYIMKHRMYDSNK